MAGQLRIGKDSVGYYRLNTPTTFLAYVDFAQEPRAVEDLRLWGYREVRYSQGITAPVVLFARAEIAWALRAWYRVVRRAWLTIGWLVRRGWLTCPDGVMLTEARPNVWPWRRGVAERGRPRPPRWRGEKT